MKNMRNQINMSLGQMWLAAFAVRPIATPMVGLRCVMSI
jgi:hypothetical protein